MSGKNNNSWVREVLEPEQLSNGKKHFGRAKLNRSTVIVLWALRIYVLLMIVLIGFQVWNAMHNGEK